MNKFSGTDRISAVAGRLGITTTDWPSVVREVEELRDSLCPEMPTPRAVTHVAEELGDVVVLTAVALWHATKQDAQIGDYGAKSANKWADRISFIREVSNAVGVEFSQGDLRNGSNFYKRAKFETILERMMARKTSGDRAAALSRAWHMWSEKVAEKGEPDGAA